MRKSRRFISQQKQVFLVDFSLTFPRFPRMSKNKLNTSLVSQTDEIAVFPFIWNSDVFDLSHVSLSEPRYQDPRHASFYCCYYLINKNLQGKCSNVLRQLKTESQWIQILKQMPITLNASFGDIQLLRYRKMIKIWTPL